MSILVGFGYRANAGKDFSGDYLRDTYGHVKTSFAGPLKQLCAEVFSLDPVMFVDRVLKESTFEIPIVPRVYADSTFERIQSLLGESLVQPSFFMAEKISLDTPRSLLQYMGTEMLNSFRETLWVELWQKKVNALLENGISVSVCDMRFPRELEAVHSLGGLCVEIQRDIAYQVVATHPSETSLQSCTDWDATLDNNGDGNHLYRQLDNLVKGVRYV